MLELMKFIFSDLSIFLGTVVLIHVVGEFFLRFVLLLFRANREFLRALKIGTTNDARENRSTGGDRENVR